jgi:hypothetical protein
MTLHLYRIQRLQWKNVYIIRDSAPLLFVLDNLGLLSDSQSYSPTCSHSSLDLHSSSSIRSLIPTYIQNLLINSFSPTAKKDQLLSLCTSIQKLGLNFSSPGAGSGGMPLFPTCADALVAGYQLGHRISTGPSTGLVQLSIQIEYLVDLVLRHGPDPNSEPGPGERWLLTTLRNLEISSPNHKSSPLISFSPRVFPSLEYVIVRVAAWNEPFKYRVLVEGIGRSAFDTTFSESHTSQTPSPSLVGIVVSGFDIRQYHKHETIPIFNLPHTFPSNDTDTTTTSTTTPSSLSTTPSTSANLPVIYHDDLPSWNPVEGTDPWVVVKKLLAVGGACPVCARMATKNAMEDGVTDVPEEEEDMPGAEPIFFFRGLGCE